MELPRGSNTDERTRPCPVCRMMISLLAVKCRYCGAEVPRPKVTERQFTASDLGGETRSTYAPSSSVMEALESFRTEETVGLPEGVDNGAAEPGIARPATGVQGPAAPARVSQRFATLGAGGRRRTPGGRAWSPWPGRLKLAAIAAAVLLAVYFGAPRVTALIREYQSPAPSAPVVVNNARTMMANDAPPIAVLEEAVRANEADPSPENQEILVGARAYVERAVRAHLNAPRISRRELLEASTLSSSALAIDPSPTMQELRREVHQDSEAYNIVLMRVVVGDSARATLRFPSSGRVYDAGPGDTIADRFKVTRITTTRVTMSDQLRGGRTFSITTAGDLLSGE